MNDGARLLLVEDDPALGRALVFALEQDRWPVDHVTSLADAFEAVLQRSYRLILLDRGLPDGDGIALVAAARSRTPRPSIIFVTARDDVADRIEGLDAGADDYLVKPFSVAELHARVRAACRRPVDRGDQTTVKAGHLTFDTISRDVRVSGRPLPLPRRELALLAVLICKAGRVVQRDHLEAEVYGWDDEVSGNALETQISRLRRRLEVEGAGVDLRTIRGVGYMLRA
ncbi:response regulator transcription factor [Brevundimonas sp. PAMC22021]|uniref:response regulator n=1 Tax=Brevundimonas sp. PAMC22021 TaxID=2861285 RepID=UPI001C62B68B|nr:response regulator transcription factor [Brevundimonas sp. PAMC22021]QYF86982.1 response regulator transcription factor [Brevundimonas sp. PAMC22021]